LVSFPRSELSTALEYVRQRSVITGDGDEAERPTIYTTGVGCTQHGRLVADTFNVKYVVTFSCNYTIHSYCGVVFRLLAGKYFSYSASRCSAYVSVRPSVILSEIIFSQNYATLCAEIILHRSKKYILRAGLPARQHAGIPFTKCFKNGVLLQRK